MSLGFILGDLRVLISTTKPQSISFIGPLVMEIHDLRFCIGLIAQTGSVINPSQQYVVKVASENILDPCKISSHVSP